MIEYKTATADKMAHKKVAFATQSHYLAVAASLKRAFLSLLWVPLASILDRQHSFLLALKDFGGDLDKQQNPKADAATMNITIDQKASKATIKIPAEKMLVTIPDLFSSIMAAEPVINLNYAEVKAKGQTWFSQ